MRGFGCLYEPDPRNVTKLQDVVLQVNVKDHINHSPS